MGTLELRTGVERVAKEVHAVKQQLAAGSGTGGSLTAADLNRLRLWVASRGTGLISNGYGLMRDNTNFTGFAFDPTDAYAGFGCFTTGRVNADIAADETLPVNPLATYEWTFAAKAKTVGSNGLTYAYMACTDADNMAITPERLALVAFRLGAPLNAGDTTLTVHADDVAKVALLYDVYKTSGATVYLNSSEYTAASGMPYPANTYSRNRLAVGLTWNKMQWANGVLTGWTVPAGTSIPADTVVTLAMAGSTYLYPMTATATAWQANRNLTNHTVPDVWTDYKVSFSLAAMLPVLRPSHGRLTDKTVYPNAGESMAASTAAVKIGWLLNRGAAGGNVTGLSALNFREI